MSKDVFWAIKSKHFGFYCGTWHTRNQAISAHVNGRWRFHPDKPGSSPLTKEERQDWLKCRSYGDSAVKVRLEEIP